MEKLIWMDRSILNILANRARVLTYTPDQDPELTYREMSVENARKCVNATYVLVLFDPNGNPSV